MHPTAIWIKTHPLYLAAPCLIGVLLFWRQPLMIILFAAWTVAAAVAQYNRYRHRQVS